MLGYREYVSCVVAGVCVSLVLMWSLRDALKTTQSLQVSVASQLREISQGADATRQALEATSEQIKAMRQTMEALTHQKELKTTQEADATRQALQWISQQIKAMRQTMEARAHEEQLMVDSLPTSKDLKRRGSAIDQPTP